MRTSLESKRSIAVTTDKMPTSLKDSYLYSLDGLRAVSILMVVGAHLGMAYKSHENYLHLIANLGVQFFFTISGFLITTLLLKEKIQSGTISLKRFYARRFIRIIPVAYLYLIVIIVANIIFNLNMSYYSVFISFLFLRNFFINAKGVNNLSTHYWSLSVEEQFYLLFPIILKKSTRVFIIFLLILIFSPVILRLYSIPSSFLNKKENIVNIFTIFFTQFQSIAIGSIFSILIFKNILKNNFSSPYRTLLTFVFLILIILLTVVGDTMHSVSNIFVSVLFSAIIYMNLELSDTISFKFLNNSVIKFIGILSYSIYIWQQPFSYSLTFIKKMSFFHPFVNNRMAEVIVSLSSLIVIFVVGYLSYYFYEKPLLKLKDKFK